MEIPTNTPLPITRFESPLCHEQQRSGGSVCKGLSVDRIGDFSMGNGFGFDSFVTPVKRLECSRLSESFSVHGIVDDDEEDDRFGESLLEEIDALCERRSMEKPSWSALSTKFVVGISCEDDNGGDEPNVGSEPLCGDDGKENEAALGFGKDEERRLEGFDDTQSLKIGKMPEELSKHMLSLNDRQREAACCDVSTPLMIVAGPGSGKVFFFLFSFLIRFF